MKINRREWIAGGAALAVTASDLGRAKGARSNVASGGYDVFLLIGQSNAYQGRDYNYINQTYGPPLSDGGTFAPGSLTSKTYPGIGDPSGVDSAWDGRTYQYGYIQYPNKIIPGNDPLDVAGTSFTNLPYTSFLPCLCRDYYNPQSLAANRSSLIIPNAHGGTGFSTGHWGVGGSAYERAVVRTNAVLAMPGSIIKAVFWHGGEADIYSMSPSQYTAAYSAMVSDFRRRVVGASDVPWILGGMVPAFVAKAGARAVAMQRTLQNIPNSIPRCAYADPAVPSVLTPNTNPLGWWRVMNVGPGAAAAPEQGTVRVTLSTTLSKSGVMTGNDVIIKDVKGATEANGTWKIKVVDEKAGIVALQGVAFVNAYTGGGSLYTRVMSSDWMKLLHFSATSQRAYAKRYYEAYRSLL